MFRVYRYNAKLIVTMTRRYDKTVQKTYLLKKELVHTNKNKILIAFSFEILCFLLNSFGS